VTEVARAVMPAGWFALEVQDRAWVGVLQPVVVGERDGDLLIDATGSSPDGRELQRADDGGGRRSVGLPLLVRLFGFTELA
jgi:hypothetical protein